MADDDITTLLNGQKGNKIMVKLRNGKVVHGVLRDFDVHMTMKLDSVVETSASDDGGSADGSAGRQRRNVGDSVLLRGDNILIVSIPDGDDHNDNAGLRNPG